MNDRFKFRFYHYETETMYEVKAICFEGRPVVTVQYNPVLKFPLDSGELMQCTGLKDKNGKSIYEGDVLGGDVYPGTYVGYCNECKSFELFVKGECESCYDELYWSLVVEENGNLEVVGNIHKNPELME